jgi:hypothetical protein
MDFFLFLLKHKPGTLYFQHMHQLPTIISLVLYLIVGVISLMMAAKIFFSPKFLPFQQEAYGKEWESIDPNLQDVILTILKLSGLGFLTIGIVLIVCPVYLFFIPDTFIRFFIPILSLIFCFGLFIFNYRLFKKTKANTPWKKSLVAIAILILGVLISIL